MFDNIWNPINFVIPRFLSVVGLPAMSFSDILVAAQVPPQQVDQLLNDGWTTEHFALCATSLEDFDAVMTEIFDTGLSPLHKASLRLAWKRCQSSSNQGAVAPTPAVASPEVAAQPLAGSWSETFAPKLTSANVSQIKAAFKKNCPAEVLLPENLPSLRLLSMVVHQKNKQDFKWIPWKYRLTSAKCDELTSSKSSKMARAEGIQLHSILMDEPPDGDLERWARSSCSSTDVRNICICHGHGGSVSSFISQSLLPEVPVFDDTEV